MGTDRPLTVDERRLLDWLIVNSGVDDVEPLSAQIEHARVVEGAPDLPTYLHLDVSGAPPVERADGPMPGSPVVVSESGEITGGLVLWVANGYLASVEHWWVTDVMPSEFPPVERLRTSGPDEPNR